MNDPALESLTDAAFDRLFASLQAAGPHLAERVGGWIAELCQGKPPRRYFTHPDAFPTVRLPLYAERALRGECDPAFQTDLICSSINGYYFVRLIDNVMDGDDTVEREILPALAGLASSFQSAYQGYFPSGHPFWSDFNRYWGASAEFTLRDATLEEVDRAAFLAVAARKTCAAMIPVAAVCRRYDRPDLVAAWEVCVERCGRWHQAINDMFDWRRDADRGIATHFLTEGRRRRKAGELLETWVMREGFGWGADLVEQWFEEARQAARELRCDELDAYLAMRAHRFAERRSDVETGLAKAQSLLDALQAAGRAESE